MRAEGDFGDSGVPVSGASDDQLSLLHAQKLMGQPTPFPPDPHGQVADGKVQVGRVRECVQDIKI